MGNRKIKRRKRNYTTNPDGSKNIPLDPTTNAFLQRQMERFKEKFGREIGPDDPIFFDENEVTPKPVGEAKYESAAVAAMVAANIAPELIYAFKKTGRLVSEENMQFLTDEELQEWRDAIAEYHEKMSNRPV